MNTSINTLPTEKETVFSGRIRTLAGEYLNHLIQDIKNAKKEILIAQYFISFQKNQSFEILKQLQRAVARNCDVKILLNAKFSTLRQKLSSERTEKFLKQSAIVPVFYPPSVILHTKLIVIDEEIVYLGSHNLNDSSLSKNIELSARFESVYLAQELKKFFVEMYNFAIEENLKRKAFFEKQKQKEKEKAF